MYGKIQTRNTWEEKSKNHTNRISAQAGKLCRLHFLLLFLLFSKVTKRMDRKPCRYRHIFVCTSACMHAWICVCVYVWEGGSKKCQCRWHTWLCASAMGVDYRVRSTKLNWTELSWAKLLCSALLRFGLLCLRAPRLSNAVFRTQFKAIKALRA